MEDPFKGIPSKENYSLAELTTIKIGGRARRVYFPHQQAQLIVLMQEFNRAQQPFFLVGGGSNLLIQDETIIRPVISLRDFNGMSFDDKQMQLTCLAGTPSIKASLESYKQGMKTLVFMHQLPGTVGGACFMNARAFGFSQEDVIHRIDVVMKNGDLQSFTSNQCQFDYKKSIFQKLDGVISQVIYQLERGEPEVIKQEMDRIYAHREQSKQFTSNTFGCTFLNDYSIGKSSGQIIDECNLKGLRIGDAEVSLSHANFIENKGQATAGDVLKLISLIKEKVWQKKQIKLQLEVQYFQEKTN